MALSQATAKIPQRQDKLESHALNLSLSQKIAFKIRGFVKISSISDYAHDVFVNVYAGRCRLHGIYYDQVHSRSDMEIRCPKCEDEFLKKRMFELWQEANV